MESSQSENFPSERNSNSRVPPRIPLLRFKSYRSQAELISVIANINANRAAQNSAQAQISAAEAEIAVVWEDLQNTTVTASIAQ